MTLQEHRDHAARLKGFKNFEQVSLKWKLRKIPFSIYSQIIHIAIINYGEQLYSIIKKEKELKKGYYWVKIHPIYEDNKWTVGYFDGYNWYLHAIKDSCNESIWKVGDYIEQKL